MVNFKLTKQPNWRLLKKDELKALSNILLKYPQVHIMSDDIYEHLVLMVLNFLQLQKLSQS